MASAEFRVLGTYTPSSWDPDTIEREFRALLPPCCALERVSIRVPHPLAPEPNPNNQQWHQDGGGVEGTIRHMVVWASETPTHLKTSDGVEFTGQPGEIVWFDNDRAFHRQPMHTNERTRWFVAVRCSGALA